MSRSLLKTGIAGVIMLILLGAASGPAPHGTFLSRKVKVGSPVKYALSYRHDASRDVFFPDSAFDYSPFRFLKRDYFPTRTTPAGSGDSVVYTLVSFETDSTQYLKLPVFVRNGKDCTAIYPTVSAVQLQSLLQAKDIRQPVLRTNTQLVFLGDQVNYPLLFLLLIAAAVLGGLSNWLFGESIRRQWQLVQLWRRHLKFRGTYQRYFRGAADPKQAVSNVEQAVFLWRLYLERMEGKPYSTFTTKETVEQFGQEKNLEGALRDVDSVVYGGVASPQTQESLKILRELAGRAYVKRKKQILTRI